MFCAHMVDFCRSGHLYQINCRPFVFQLSLYCTHLKIFIVIEDGRGYGFVQFFDEVERDLCCMEMNGKGGLGQKLIRVKPAIIPK